MAWQGRMRDIKGRRYFQKLPEATQQDLKFISAWCWHDHNKVFIECRLKADLSTRVLIRMHRHTGQVLFRRQYFV